MNLSMVKKNDHLATGSKARDALRTALLSLTNSKIADGTLKP
jgi:hypothetical protein